MAQLLLMIGLLTAFGFFTGLAVRKIHLPSIIGYMLIGVLFGPSLGLHRLTGLGFELDVLHKLEFVSEIALGYVAFGIGAELNIQSLRRLGWGIISIIFMESFGAFLVVFFGIWLLTSNLVLALAFAAMAPASAPAGTVAVIRENNAQGPLTRALYAVVGFDDGLAIIIYGFVFAVIAALVKNTGASSEISFSAVLLLPLKEIGLSLLIGGLLGLLFCILSENLKKTEHIFILLFVTILVGVGMSNLLHLSLILTNLVIGFVLVNTRSEDLTTRVVQNINHIFPLLFVLFFVLAGAHLDVKILPSLGAIGAVYILTRTIGLVFGSRLGAIIGKSDDTIRKYIGLGILSQAGVAIALSLGLYNELAGFGEESRKIGAVVLTTITATCVVFEIAGPILTYYALKKAGEIPAVSD